MSILSISLFNDHATCMKGIDGSTYHEQDPTP